MKSVSLSSPRHLAGTVKPSILDGLARRSVLCQLLKLDTGSLRLVEGPGEIRFGSDDDSEPCASIQVIDPRFFSEIAFGGSIGGGEAYIHGFGLVNEAVRQIRGDSTSQVEGAELSLMVAGPGYAPGSAVLFCRDSRPS